VNEGFFLKLDQKILSFSLNNSETIMSLWSKFRRLSFPHYLCLKRKTNTMTRLMPTIVSLATAVQGWNLGHVYTPMLFRMSPASDLFDRQRGIAQRIFDQKGISSPRYELVDDENKFLLTVDVPGVKEADLDIRIDDGRPTGCSD
jgi:hypothetical protein